MAAVLTSRRERERQHMRTLVLQRGERHDGLTERLARSKANAGAPTTLAEENEAVSVRAKRRTTFDDDDGAEHTGSNNDEGRAPPRPATTFFF